MAPRPFTVNALRGKTKERFYDTVTAEGWREAERLVQTASGSGIGRILFVTNSFEGDLNAADAAQYADPDQRNPEDPAFEDVLGLWRPFTLTGLWEATMERWCDTVWARSAYEAEAITQALWGKGKGRALLVSRVYEGDIMPADDAKYTDPDRTD